MTVLGYDSTVPVDPRRAARPRPRRAPRAADAVPRRRPALRLLRGQRRAGGHAPRSASSRRPAATPSSSRAAARPRWRAPARSSRAGIPVMGHVGLTPQTSTALGGYRAQGRTAAAAERIAREALALQEAGCFSLVFEAIPSAVSELPDGPPRGPGDRHRRRPRRRRPGARLPRPARHPRGPRGALRQALREPPGRDGRRRRGLRGRRAGAAATRGPSTATRCPRRSSMELRTSLGGR